MTYVVTESCIRCKDCVEVCPVDEKSARAQKYPAMRVERLGGS